MAGSRSSPLGCRTTWSAGALLVQLARDDRGQQHPLEDLASGHLLLDDKGYLGVAKLSLAMRDINRRGAPPNDADDVLGQAEGVGRRPSRSSADAVVPKAVAASTEASILQVPSTRRDSRSAIWRSRSFAAC